MPLSRSDGEIFAAHADALKGDIRKVLPATVTAVHPDRQTVDVQVAINNVLHDDIGYTIVEPAVSISDVPLGVMRGGGFLVWMPVAVGDSVLLIFSDLSCDAWRAGDGTPSTPGFQGKHTADSPFAIPCCAPDGKMFASPNADPGKIIIGKDGGTAQIRISATDIELGAPAGDAVGLASKIDAAVSTIITAFNGHTHILTLTAGTGTAAPTAAPLSAQPSAASTLVKCG